MREERLFTNDQMRAMEVKPPTPSERIMPHAEMAIGVDREHVGKIIKTGRLLSQHDTGTSGGSYAPDYRAEVEARWGMKKPIYGVWRHPELAPRLWGAGRHNTDYGTYGTVTFLPKKVLQGKQFFLYGDSLHRSMDRPQEIGMPDRRFDSTTDPGEPYVEAQFQPYDPDAGLPLSDIKGVEITAYGGDHGAWDNWDARPAIALHKAGVPATLIRRGDHIQDTLYGQFDDPNLSEEDLGRRQAFSASLREHDYDTGDNESRNWRNREYTPYRKWIPQREWNPHVR